MHKYKPWFVSFVFFPSITHNKALICACSLPLFSNSLFSIAFQFQPHIIFISYFAAFLSIDLLSDLSAECMPHAFAYITFTMDFWPFDIFWPCWWNAAAYMIAPHPAMSPHSSHLSLFLTPCLSRMNTVFHLCTVFLLNTDPVSSSALSMCPAPVTQESFYIALFSVCF